MIEACLRLKLELLPLLLARVLLVPANLNLPHPVDASAGAWELRMGAVGEGEMN